MTVTLYLGDCRDYLDQVPRDCVVVTDPPYGIRHRRGQCRDRGKGITLGTSIMAGDDTPFDPAPWLQFPTVVLWGANWYADRLPPGRWLIWDKLENGGSGDFSEAEVAWCNVGKALKIFRHMWLGVQRRSEVGEARLHPTQKPIALMTWVFEEVGIPVGATVFDPYMGSGTTGVAAVLTGRHFIGCEINPDYYSIAEKRIHDAQLQMPMEGFQR